MPKIEEMSKDSLKMRHEEYKLFLQIIWSGMLTLTISLIFASFTKTIQIEPFIAVLIGIVIVLGGIILTLIVFTNKFNDIRSEMDKKCDKI